MFHLQIWKCARKVRENEHDLLYKEKLDHTGPHEQVCIIEGIEPAMKFLDEKNSGGDGFYYWKVVGE